MSITPQQGWSFSLGPNDPTPEKIQHFLEDTGLTLNPNASDEDGLMYFKNDKNFPNPHWILNNVFRKRPLGASD